MAKSKKRRKEKSVVQNIKISPKDYIRTIARKLPIYKTFIAENLFDDGIGNVIVVREKRNGDKVIGSYLVDVWCLGVKDTFFKIYKSYEYEDFMDKYFKAPPNNLIETETNYTFNLIYGAVEYADDLGLPPHKDFSITKYILDDIDNILYEDIVFGKEEGKPFFVSGPYDQSSKIIKILNESVGIGGYDYICEVDEFA